MKLSKAMQAVIDKMADGYWLIENQISQSEWLEPDPLSPETDNIYLKPGTITDLAMMDLLETDCGKDELLRGMHRFNEIPYRLLKQGRALAKQSN